jgi:hypothetical protein
MSNNACPLFPEQRSLKGPGSDPNYEQMDGVPGRENFDEEGHHATLSKTPITKAISRIGNMPHKNP